MYLLTKEQYYIIPVTSMYKIINNISVNESILATGIIHSALRDVMREEGGGGRCTLITVYVYVCGIGGRG